jgi:membrane-associated phospholipid phosphatase
MTELPNPGREPGAEHLARRFDAASTRPTLAAVLRDLGRLDLAVYRAIAATPTPTLDGPLRQLSDAATRWKLWLGIAGVMALVGGRGGRRAAVNGVAALAVDSAVVNLAGKQWFRRRRPDPAGAGVPDRRRVRMPTSASFPSGHSASGFAFAEAVGEVAPGVAMALRLLAAVVGYSRVHTGAHYPGDVLAGALLGSSIGEAVGLGARWTRGRRRATSVES